MRRRSRFISIAAALVLVAGPVTLWAGSTSAESVSRVAADYSIGGNWGHHDRTLYVSNTSGDRVSGQRGSDGSWSGSGPSSDLKGCAKAQYTTIGAAVNAASAGDTIVVCPGVYTEDVVVPAAKPLTIEGVGHPRINANNLDNGVQVLASGSTVEGLTVAYAIGEGILVGSLTATAGTLTGTSGTLTGTSGTISNVTISDNTVIVNDRGNPLGGLISGSSYAECNAGPGNIPGDCGEGIHLLSADDSKVIDNYVTGNSGGILLTDENGPTYGNLIQGNDSFANAYDCGITLAGHHIGTTTNGITWSTVLPSVGGVYDNTVRGNRSADNGVLGQGGGILMATGAPGGGVYDNVVEGNHVVGNGLAGVTVHSHAPGQDLNGNVIRANVIGTNNLDGDFDFSPLVDSATTGVLVATAVNPIAITIVGNQIKYNSYGIWMTPGVTATTAPPPNTFVGVTTPIFTAT